MEKTTSNPPPTTPPTTPPVKPKKTYAETVMAGHSVEHATSAIDIPSSCTEPSTSISSRTVTQTIDLKDTPALGKKKKKKNRGGLQEDLSKLTMSDYTPKIQKSQRHSKPSTPRKPHKPQETVESSSTAAHTSTDASKEEKTKGDRKSMAKTDSLQGAASATIQKQVTEDSESEQGCDYDKIVVSILSFKRRYPIVRPKAKFLEELKKHCKSEGGVSTCYAIVLDYMYAVKDFIDKQKDAPSNPKIAKLSQVKVNFLNKQLPKVKETLMQLEKLLELLLTNAFKEDLEYQLIKVVLDELRLVVFTNLTNMELALKTAIKNPNYVKQTHGVMDFFMKEFYCLSEVLEVMEQRFKTPRPEGVEIDVSAEYLEIQIDE